MNASFYAQTAAVEDHHWWFSARRQVAADLITRMGLEQGARILDLGCGTGRTTRFLEGFGNVVGLDKSAIALEMAGSKVNETRLVCGDVNGLGRTFAPESFDLVTIFCVLYHEWVRNEVYVLGQVAGVLKPGGYVLWMEPAFQLLKRMHDEVDFGRRRYRLADARRILDLAGFEVTEARYFNAAAFPACLLSAVAHRAGLWVHRAQDGKGDGAIGELRTPPAGVNRALERCLALEHRLSRRIPIPFGVTLLAVARKKSGG